MRARRRLALAHGAALGLDRAVRAGRFPADGRDLLAAVLELTRPRPSIWARAGRAVGRTLLDLPNEGD